MKNALEAALKSKDAEEIKEFFESIIALMPGHVYWKDINGVLLGCNDMQAKSAGFTSREELIGKTDYELPWKDQADSLREIDARVMETGEPITLEEASTLSDGTKAIFLSKKVPLYHKNEVVGILGISFDITEQKRNEEDLLKTKSMLENVINTIPGHVYWKDKESKFLGVNDSQAIDLGFKSRHEIIGLSPYETLPKDSADDVTNNDKEVMKTGLGKLVEEELIWHDGVKTIWLSNKVPLRNEDQEIIGILGVSLDVTELKQTQQQLIDTRSKLEGMTLIASIMAHELRTPLSAFAFAADGVKAVFPHLKQAYLTAKENGVPVHEFMPGYLEGIEQSLMSMDKEMRAAFTFIDMALLNSDPQLDNTQKSTFSISECIDEALSRYPFHGQRKLVRWQPDPQLDFAVAGDKLLVIHVLFNLIKNALYYVAAAGKGEIQIWLERQADFNKLYFKDTGAGIDAEIIPRIFDRFYSRTYHGAGIGLTFCKSVLVSLGGDIACASEKHHYTMFTLSFPVSMVKPRL